MPRWLVSVVVLGVAAFVRLRNYDVTMFAYDQINLLGQARLVLAGQWNVAGPDARGLDIVGPLYSYLLAALLWIADDPAFVAWCGVAYDVVAAWLIYDTGRRFAGNVAGVVGAVTYACVPVLVLSTRIVWNPGLLPPTVALAWWLLARYCERPTTWTLVLIGALSGVMPMIHATGVFYSAALMLAAVVAHRPRLRVLAAACVAGVIPLLLVLPRLAGSTSGMAGLWSRLVLMDVSSTLRGVAGLILDFPRAVLGERWVATASSAVLHLQAAIAAAGIAYGLSRRSTFRALWWGIALAAAGNVGSALIYSLHLSWYYFTPVIPGMCLALASAVTVAPPRWRAAVATTAVLLCVVHLPFVDAFDRQALASGFIRLQGQGLTLRLPPSDIALHFPTIHDLRSIGAALRGVVPDGATAMQVAHGTRGELWRETGAEFLPAAATATPRWRTEFMLVGANATVLRPDARLVDGRVCAFDRPAVTWRARNDVMAGWESPTLDDASWATIEFPQRVAKPSRAGLQLPLLTWPSPRVVLRGRFVVDGPSRRRLFSVVVHGLGDAQHRVGDVFLNGSVVAVAKERVMYSPFSRNHEWLIDVGDGVRPGENTLALIVDGPRPIFDLDVFEVACLDADWYH